MGIWESEGMMRLSGSLKERLGNIVGVEREGQGNGNKSFEFY